MDVSRRQSAELILFQHKERKGKQTGRPPKRIKRTPERDVKLVTKAWRRADNDFESM